jgi:Holliday junction DNA helicase RuvA
MIAKLRGLLDSFTADHAVIDVNGVGYLVFASTRTLSSLPSAARSCSTPRCR